MNPIYQQMWKLAKPLYQVARPMDIDHIEWFMETASMVCVEEGLDDTILLPLAILHDVGYSKVPRVEVTDYYQLDTRRLHMQEGKKLAIDILKKVNYPSEKIDVIANYIGVHDNWAFGEVDMFISDAILGTFKDLDYLWNYTEKGSRALQKILGLDDLKTLEHLRNETSPIYGRKPFSNKTTQRLHDEYMVARENDLGIRSPLKEVK